MRIVFFGATDIGYRCCELLFEMGENVAGIFTIPQEFRISYSPAPVKNVNFRNFDELAGKHNVPVVHVTSKMSEPQYVEALREWKPDFGLAIGWYYMIPRVVRDLFPRGVAGIHAALLPRYRGNAPLVWAIINGEKKTGVTFFYFADGVDSGDIIAQQEIEISRDDTIKTVYDKATEASLAILRKYVPMIREGTAPRILQPATDEKPYPARKPEDGLIDWSKSPEEIRNFIRAQTKPYPGAFTCINGKKVIIWDADIIEEQK
jgi:methionyl-tRNA formyltransferase